MNRKRDHGYGWRIGATAPSIFIAAALLAIGPRPMPMRISDAAVDPKANGRANQTDKLRDEAMPVLRQYVYGYRRQVPAEILAWLPGRVEAYPGDAEAAFYLAMIYRLNRAQFPAKQTEFAPLLRRAADLGFAPAKAVLGLALIVGEAVPEEPQAGLRLIREALREGDPFAMYAMGEVKMQGLAGEAKDLPGAAGFFRKSAESGVARGYAAAGRVLFVMGMKDEARVTLEKGVAAGDPDAQMRLALWQLYEEKPADGGAARAMMQKAAQSGYPPAQRWMGRFHQEGTGGKPDDEKAVEWFRRAVAGGDAEAKYYLAYAYLNGRGVDKDLAAGIKALKEAAEAGVPEAMFDLGKAYGYGWWGLGEEKDEGLRLIRQAAAKGSKPAQEFLRKQEKPPAE